MRIRVRRRALLVVVTSMLGISGLLLASMPLVGSLQPSEAVYDKYLHVDVSGLAVGEYIDAETDTGFYRVLKRDKASFQVISLWKHQSEYLLSGPFGGYEYCKNFVQQDGFQCFDRYSHNGELSWLNQYRWTSDGRYIGDEEERFNLPRVEFKRSGKYLVLLGQLAAPDKPR